MEYVGLDEPGNALIGKQTFLPIGTMNRRLPGVQTSYCVAGRSMAPSVTSMRFTFVLAVLALWPLSIGAADMSLEEAGKNLAAEDFAVR